MVVNFQLLVNRKLTVITRIFIGVFLLLGGNLLLGQQSNNTPVIVGPISANFDGCAAKSYDKWFECDINKRNEVEVPNLEKIKEYKTPASGHLYVVVKSTCKGWACEAGGYNYFLNVQYQKPNGKWESVPGSAWAVWRDANGNIGGHNDPNKIGWKPHLEKDTPIKVVMRKSHAAPNSSFEWVEYNKTTYDGNVYLIPDKPMKEAVKTDIQIKEINGGKLFDVETGKQIYEGDYIDYDQQVELIGGKNDNARIEYHGTVSTVRGGTKIMVMKQKDRQESRIQLFFGRIFSWFKSKANRPSGYQVRTSNAIVGVEGTVFSTKYDQNTGQTSVAVASGKVTLKCLNGDAPVFEVPPGWKYIMNEDCSICTERLTSDETQYIQSVKGGVNKGPFKVGDIYHITQYYNGQVWNGDIEVLEVGENYFRGKSTNSVAVWRCYLNENTIRLENDCAESAGEPCYQVHRGMLEDGKYIGSWKFTDHPKGKGNWWSSIGSFEFYKQ